MTHNNPYSFLADKLALRKQSRCWKGYEPVPGKEPYSEDSCRPVGSKKKKAKKKTEKKADALPGGAADNMSDSEFNPQELRKGLKEEKEHTNEPAVAKEIAKDHLVEEGPTYYTDMGDKDKAMHKKSALSTLYDLAVNREDNENSTALLFKLAEIKKDVVGDKVKSKDTSGSLLQNALEKYVKPMQGKAKEIRSKLEEVDKPSIVPSRMKFDYGTRNFATKMPKDQRKLLLDNIYAFRKPLKNAAGFIENFGNTRD